MTDEAHALLPCPFCGGDPEIDHDDYPRRDYQGAHQWWLIQCSKCACKTTISTRDAVIAAWNRRAAPDQPAQAQQPQRPLADEEKQRLNPYALSGSSKSIWLSGFAAAERAHSILADTSAVDKAFPAEPTLAAAAMAG